MKPQIVIDWENAYAQIEEWVPKCCYTCFNFNRKNGACYAYGETVPDSFKEKIDECKKWNRDPF